MIVTIQIPSLPDKSDKFESFWLDTLFRAMPSTERVDNAWAVMYVRRVDAAMTEYRLGAEQVGACWNNPASMGLLANNRSICHYETCINNAYAARCCLERLRVDAAPAKLRAALQALTPTFMSYSQARDPLRLIRNGIQHGEEWILEGKIGADESHTLRANGVEQPHPLDAGMTIKEIDRLVLGKHTLFFNDLASWLVEMADVVDVIR